MKFSSLCKKDDSRNKGLDKEDHRTWLIVESDDLYPAVLKRFEEVKKGVEGSGAELFNDIDSAVIARTYMRKVKKLTLGQLALAQTARDDTKEADIEERAAVLELARFWFTRALKIEFGPIGIRILKGSGVWRL